MVALGQQIPAWVRWLGPVACLALAACGLSRAEQIKAQYAVANKEIAACNQKFALRRPTAAANVNCVSDVQIRIVRPIFPHPDLLDLLIASRRLVATRMDRGELGDEEARLAFAQTTTRIVSEMERRDLAHRSVAAQEAANSPVVCTRSGNSTFCY